MNTLYVVATPIGNLNDISKRALEVLAQVDLILAEDTRVTQKLLNHFSIKTSTLSYHQHSKLKKVHYILKLLRQGKDLALVSDAGTPGISDPGGKLVEEVTAQLGNEVEIITIPGPSAVTAGASISGFPMEKFLFLGFPPAKRKRAKFFKEVVDSKYPVILYESPHRILKTLNDLNEIWKEPSSFQVVVCREITKKFESVYRGTPQEVIAQLGNGKVKGEFVIVVKTKN